MSVSASNVIIETIKQAEDGEGIILRLYESQRRRGQVEIKFSKPVQAAWTTNLLEENLEPMQVKDASIRIDLNPYQIVTLRVIPA